MSVRTIGLLLCALVADAAEPRVLVIAFGPFAGRGVNGSQTVAESLNAEQIGAPLAHAVLAVRWGEPERRLPELIAAARPTLVLGLGEGLPDRVAVERLAHNRRAHRDEAGAAPPAAWIERAGPDERRLTLRFDPAWFAARRDIVASDDAGDYLCNDLAWHLAGIGGATAGFVHLPPQGETSAGDYVAAWRPVVLELIRRNLAR